MNKTQLKDVYGNIFIAWFDEDGTVLLAGKDIRKIKLSLYTQMISTGELTQAT